MEDIPNRGPKYNGVVWFLTALAIIAVSLRLVSRTKLASSDRSFGIEDVLMAIAILIDIAASVVFTLAVAAGTGRHMVDIPPSSIPYAIKINIIATNVVFYGAELAKTAIALLLIRLFRPRKLVAAGLLGGAIIENLSTVVITVLFFTQCSPAAGTWNPSIKAKCIDPMILTGVSYFSSAWSAFLDLVFAIYPCVVIANLKMPIKQKIALSAILGTGFFVCATQIYKMTKLNSISAMQDYTWAYGDLLFWTMIQAQVMIIAACVPTLRPFAHLIKTRASSVFSRIHSGRSSSTDSGSRSRGLTRASVEKGDDSHSGSSIDGGFAGNGIGRTVEWKVQTRARSREATPM